MNKLKKIILSGGVAAVAVVGIGSVASAATSAPAKTLAPSTSTMPYTGADNERTWVALGDARNAWTGANNAQAAAKAAASPTSFANYDGSSNGGLTVTGTASVPLSSSPTLASGHDYLITVNANVTGGDVTPAPVISVGSSLGDAIRLGGGNVSGKNEVSLSGSEVVKGDGGTLQATATNSNTDGYSSFIVNDLTVTVTQES
jgi:hypothetical protein